MNNLGGARMTEQFSNHFAAVQGACDRMTDLKRMPPADKQAISAFITTGKFWSAGAMRILFAIRAVCGRKSNAG